MVSKIATIIFTICIFFVCSIAGYSQTKQTQFFFELAGSGGLGSFNIEKEFAQKNKVQFTYRAGISFSPIDKNNGSAIIFPLMVNAIIGEPKHQFEAGIGQGLTITTKGSAFALATGALGYRHQIKESRMFYRLTYTPLISYLIDTQIQHWAGVSLGFVLEKNKK